MRVLAVAVIALLAACASSGGGSEPDIPRDANSPFPVQRGTAPQPPAQARAGQTAPPEGRTSGGIDFGQWRGADPAVYGPSFQTQMRQRYAGKTDAEIKADLEANGFACEDSAQLQCRIEIMERQCGIDWYVVVESNRAEPIAGYDVMCLGARR